MRVFSVVCVVVRQNAVQVSDLLFNSMLMFESGMSCGYPLWLMLACIFLAIGVSVL